MIIPWTDLKNKPLKIMIKQVFVLLNQRNHADYDPEQEELDAQEEKQQKLREWEEKIAKEATLLDSNSKSTPTSTNSSYFGQIWNAIVDNIQIFIGDIHVRYEDQVSCPEKPFGLGFTIHELSAVSTDEKWQEAKEGAVPLVNTGVIFKICKMKWFGVYCATENVQSALGDTLGKSSYITDFAEKEQEIKKFFEKEIATTQNVSVRRQYIMNPVSSVGKLVWRKEASVDTPSYTLELDFDDLAFNLDNGQKETFEGVFATLEQARRNYPYRKFKPPVAITPKMDARVWLQYAGKSVIHDVHEKNYKWTWSFFKKRRNDRWAYINLYTALRLDVIEEEEIETLKHLELELSFDDIRLYRHLALMKLKKNAETVSHTISQSESQTTDNDDIGKSTSPTNEPSSAGWYGWITGSSASASPAADQATSPLADWDEQFQRIYEKFDFQVENVRDEDSFPFDSVRSRISCRLKSGSFTLRKFVGGDEWAKDLIMVRFEGLQVNQVNYPRSSSMVDMKVHYLVVSEPGTASIFSTLIEAKMAVPENSALSSSDAVTSSSNMDFFSLVYEQKPLDQRADSGLFIKMHPLKVIVNPLLIREITHFFIPNPKYRQDAGYSRITEAAQGAFNEVTAVSRAGLFFAIEEHKTMDLRIEADAPIFVIPAFETDNLLEEQGQVIVLDAGHMHVSSDLVQSEMKKKIMAAQEDKVKVSMNDLVMEMYDKFTIRFSNAKIMVADVDHTKDTLVFVNPDHLLEDLDILLRLDVSILPNSPEFTKFKFSGSLPRLHVNVSEQKLQIIKTVGELMSVITASDTSLSKSTLNDEPVKPILLASPSFLNPDDLFDALPSVLAAENDDDTPISDSQTIIPTSKHQQTLFDLKFDFDRASVVLFEHVKGSSKPLALFEAKNIHFGIIQKVGDIVMTATLGSLVIDDLTAHDDSLYKSLVSPDMDASFSPIDHNSGNAVVLIRLDYHSMTSAIDGDTSDISISVSPVRFVLARECILKVYHVAMTLLGPGKPMPSTGNLANKSITNMHSDQYSSTSNLSSSTHLRIKINRITTVFAENDSTIGSCVMEGFDLSLNSSQDVLFLSGTVGKLSIFQDDDSKCMLLIEEKKALDFEFETFDTERATARGFDSSITINATSWRFVYDPHYLSKIFSYFEQFQEMNAMMDQARRAAYDTQRQMQSTAGKSFICFKAMTPIIVVPNGRGVHADSMIFFPGTVIAESVGSGPHSSLVEDRFNISVNSLKLQSSFYHVDGIKYRDMVQDVNLSIQYDRMKPIPTIPMTCFQFKVSDVNIQVTNHQYRLFAEIMQLINTPLQQHSKLPQSSSPSSYTDIYVSFPKISFEAYNCPSKFSDPSIYSLARLLGSVGTAKLSTKSNGPLNFELCFSSLSIIDTRHSNSAFRDIMTPIKEIDDQFVLRYCSTPTSIDYSVTIDRAKLILEVDHIFAIRAFALNAWNSDIPQPTPPPITSVSQKSSLGRVSFVDVEIILVSEPEKPNTDAVILTSKNWVNVLDSLLSVSFQDLGMYFCIMDRRKETQLRFLDDCNFTYTLDDSFKADGVSVYNAALETTKLLFRVSQHDIYLLNGLINRIQAGMAPAPIVGEDGTLSPAPIVIRENLTQKFHLTIESMQAFLIDDSNNLLMPVLEFGMDRTVYDMSNWCTNFEFNLGISLFANYFNIKNSHWEPIVETSQFSVNGLHEQDGKRSISALARKKIELNVTHVFVETMIGLMESIKSPEKRVSSRIESRSPYIVKNSTGYPLVMWTDGKVSENTDSLLVKLADGESVDWRFEDWRTVRERTAPIPNKLAIQIEGQFWETLKGVYVDQEGSNTYILRPAIQNILHRIVVDVELHDKVKFVTFRSSKIIENSTKIEIEIAFTRNTNDQKPKIVRIAPGKKYPIPIESSYHDSIYVRPADFGYKWSMQGIHWRDLVGKKRIREYLVNCPNYEASIPHFNFQLNCLFSGDQIDYPELTMKFMAPFVLENLMPFDFRYVIQDKVSRQKHTSVLAKGTKEYLHTLDPSHLLALSIAVKEKGLAQKEAVIITSTDLEYRDDHLALEDLAGNQLTLRIFYTDSLQSGRLVSIICPYLIINKTGVDMQFSAKSLLSSNRLSAGQGSQNHTSDTIEPIMFSYSTLEPLRSRALIKMIDSEWSRAVSFEAVGSEYMVNLPTVGGKDALVGVDIQEGQGKYHMSKIITIGPRFFLRNNFNQDLSYAQARVLQPKILKPGEIISLMKLNTSPEHDDYHLCVRFATMMGAWSNPFSLTQVGNIFLKLGRIGSLTEDLIRVDITIEKATIFVTFSQAQERWPFKIQNETDVDVNYYQDGSSKQYTIVPSEEQFYAWDFPSFENKSFVIEVNGRQRRIEFSELGSLVPFKYPTSGSRSVMALELNAEGPTIVLKMSPYDPSRSVYQDSRTSDEFKMKDEDTQILSNLIIRIEGIGISVISRDMNEIFYASAKGLALVITETVTQTITNFKIKWLQVDNQLKGVLNPIFIYPTILKQNEKELDIENPVFFATYSVSKDKSLGVEYYPWLSVLLQELSVDLDEDFLRSLIDFMIFSSTEPVEFTTPCDLGRQIAFPNLADGTDRLYFEKFFLQPVQINMSFSRSERKEEKKNSEERQHSEGGLSVIYDVLTMTIGNIHDAPIRLNALELMHPIFSTAQFKELIMKFYMREIYGQVHRIVGSADFLGNPVGLFNNVASGVKDMFYEPLQGFEITKPEEFGIGVAKGAGSLMKKTVFGLSDTFSKFTGSIGKGLTAMTMDSKFQESRRLAGRNRPKHVGQGMAKGAKGLVTGLASGITGIISQPIQGAQESGFEGFFVGLGKGLLGAVAKPVIGVVDLATSVSEGIKSTTTVYEDDLDRQRLPRHIGKDRILKPYDLREALGQNWLREVNNAKYFSEIYLCHLELRLEDLAAILTETRVLMIHIKKLSLEYNAPFHDIRKIEASSETEISLVIKGNSQNQWVIPCPSSQTAKWFREKIETAYTDYIKTTRDFD